MHCSTIIGKPATVGWKADGTKIVQMKIVLYGYSLLYGSRMHKVF